MDGEAEESTSLAMLRRDTVQSDRATGRVHKVSPLLQTPRRYKGIYEDVWSWQQTHKLTTPTIGRQEDTTLGVSSRAARLSLYVSLSLPFTCQSHLSVLVCTVFAVLPQTATTAWQS